MLETRITMASERRQERGEIEDCFLRYRESGDREALAKSLTLAQGELRRVARFYALDPAEEDDVVQAVEAQLRVLDLVRSVEAHA